MRSILRRKLNTSTSYGTVSRIDACAHMALQRVHGHENKCTAGMKSWSVDAPVTLVLHGNVDEML